MDSVKGKYGELLEQSGHMPNLFDRELLTAVTSLVRQSDFGEKESTVEVVLHELPIVNQPPEMADQVDVLASGALHLLRIAFCGCGTVGIGLGSPFPVDRQYSMQLFYKPS